jgi:hypothetical protein
VLAEIERDPSAPAIAKLLAADAFVASGDARRAERLWMDVLSNERWGSALIPEFHRRFRNTISYLEVLQRVAAARSPECYLEIGVNTGASLIRFANTRLRIGVDPDLSRVGRSPSEGAVLYEMPSAAFFTQGIFRSDFPGERVDVGFIDGFHSFEAVWDDFFGLHPLMAADGIVLVHDVLPFDAVSVGTDQTAPSWTGDVWKFPLALRALDTRLEISLLDSRPTGLLVITGFDRARDLPDAAARDAAYRQFADAVWHPRVQSDAELDVLLSDDATVDRLVAVR